MFAGISSLWRPKALLFFRCKKYDNTASPILCVYSNIFSYVTCYMVFATTSWALYPPRNSEIEVKFDKDPLNMWQWSLKIADGGVYPSLLIDHPWLPPGHKQNKTKNKKTKNKALRIDSWSFKQLCFLMFLGRTWMEELVWGGESAW